MGLSTQTAQDALGDDFDRYRYLSATTRPNVHRKRVQRAWERAVCAQRWALADRLFDHLWPGVCPAEDYDL